MVQRSVWFFDTGSFPSSPQHPQACLFVYSFVQLTLGSSELHLGGPRGDNALAKKEGLLGCSPAIPVPPTP